MTNSQQRRLWIVVAGLVLATAVIITRLIVFQIVQGREWADKLVDEASVVAKPERGVILDRNGAVLAANTAEYRIGVSPALVDDPQALATALTGILQIPLYDILTDLTTTSSYQVLASPVSNEIAQAVAALDENALRIEPLPRRFYPQDDMMCHTLGFLNFDGEGLAGLEAFYESELAGEAASARVKISPLEVQKSVVAREGADVVLTIDRSVQHLVEQHLADALTTHGATSGEIIVMDPRTGAILALASLPCYDLSADSSLVDPFVGRQYEPGSVMKLITMAAALDSGTVTSDSTYYDAGALEVGGHRTVNWDRSAPGTVDMTTLLSRSLNVGAATLATWMGAESYYNYMGQFSFGRITGVDLAGETGGLMPLPGSPFWIESYLATNSYGQALAVTPMQMILSVSALANDGKIMQPHIVQEIRGEENTLVHQPTIYSQPISAQTAQQVTTMAITAVAREVSAAQVPGYTIAGKTGTAQIPDPITKGYHPTDVIGSFIGWLPADDPQLLILVKIDRPTSAPWGSQTAAPVFADLAEDLVVLLNIPPDSFRLQADLAAYNNNSP